MKHRHQKKEFPIFFVFTVILFLTIIISVIFFGACKTAETVRKSMERLILSNMSSDIDDYAKIISSSLENGTAGPETVLDSDLFERKVLFITDKEGNFLGRSRSADSIFTESNIFHAVSGGTYSGGLGESEIRGYLRKGESCSFSVELHRVKYISFCSLEYGDCRLIYMMRDSEVDAICGEGKTCLDNVRYFTGACITAAAALIIVMCAYIISAGRTNSHRHKLDSIALNDAKNVLAVYSDVIRVLIRSYDKIFYVNADDNRYVMFRYLNSDNVMHKRCECEDFWNREKSLIIRNTLTEDKKLVEEFFDKNSLAANISSKGGSESIRFKMISNGSEKYFCLMACILKDGNGVQHYIIGLKDVDSMVRHDMDLLLQKETALRRLSVYKGVMLNSMLAYFEVDITENRIIDGPYAAEKNTGIPYLKKSVFKSFDSLDGLAKKWGEFFYKPGKERDAYIQGNKSETLKRQFESGRSTVNFYFEVKSGSETVKNVKQSYYMMSRMEDGNIQAVCVLYDETEKVEHEREIRNLTESLTLSRIKISTGQMQPHFLYNILGSIREIILEDPQYASDLICDFTTHLRACVKSLSNDDLIPFSKEIDNIKAYVNIEKMRFGDRMQVEFDIRNDDFDVMPLSIQPIVENSIRHGLFEKKDGIGKVKISSFRINGYNVVAVVDNGVGFDYEQIQKEVREHKRDSTGLSNLTLRLETVLKAKVYFDSVIGEGTTVTVLIPEKKEDTDIESDYS